MWEEGKEKEARADEEKIDEGRKKSGT